MRRESFIRDRDRELVQIVDAALDDAARRSGEWLKCKPGCTQCCHGVFAISQLDAFRLRKGLRQLESTDPERARQVRQRAAAQVAKLAPAFPGDPETGVLSEETEAFDEFANEEPCPALDPATGTCSLYEFRPMTCRVFGPPVRSQDGIGVCELCFHGATEQEILACEMRTGTDELEAELLNCVQENTGKRGSTIVAYVLK